MQNFLTFLLSSAKNMDMLSFMFQKYILTLVEEQILSPFSSSHAFWVRFPLETEYNCDIRDFNPKVSHISLEIS